MGFVGSPHGTHAYIALHLLPSKAYLERALNLAQRLKDIQEEVAMDKETKKIHGEHRRQIDVAVHSMEIGAAWKTAERC
jgi:hypothetical protein